MIDPRYLARAGAISRDVYLLVIDDLNTPFRLNFEEKMFACFTALDTRGRSAHDIGRLCVQLLDAGCVWLSAWGPDCARVDDIMDEEKVGPRPPETERGLVMTTWHERERLSEALEFFLTFSQPHEEDFPGPCDIALIISLARTRWVRVIERVVLAAR